MASLFCGKDGRSILFSESYSSTISVRVGDTPACILPLYLSMADI